MKPKEAFNMYLPGGSIIAAGVTVWVLGGYWEWTALLCVLGASIIVERTVLYIWLVLRGRKPHA
jgi:hypothetical protein